MSVSLFIVIALLLQDPAQGVAPGDDEQFCDNLRAAGTILTPDYDPTLMVLMDTWNYNNLFPPRSGAVWESVDNDNNNPTGTTTSWIQNSNSPCLQTAQVCGFSAGMQNNWLITQLINRTVNGTQLPQVSVMIEFEQQDCDVTLNCQRTFNTHVYERSSENTTASRITTNYRQVQRVSPDDTSDNRVNETINIGFATDSQETSFYFAVQDETSCIVITRMIVFYNVCPQRTSDLIHYPQIIAPRSPTSSNPAVAPITVTASCVANAIAVSGANPLVILCSSGGLWSSSPGNGCTCLPGHSNQGQVCSSCPTGTYLSPSNGSCSTCPANSVSEREGLTQCTCVDGYYRVLLGEEDLPCYLPPTAPQDLKIVSLSETSLSVSWRPPERSGNLTYGIYISDNGNDRVKLRSVTGTSAVILDLLPGHSYIVSVSSENAITDQVPAEQLSSIAASITVTTPTDPTSKFEPEVSAVPLAAIIVSSLLVFIAVVIVTSVLIICAKLRGKAQQVAEDLYSEVGPPTLPVRTEKNSAYGQKADVGDYLVPTSAHSAIALEKDQKENEMHQINPAIAVTENTATAIADTEIQTPAIAATENLAYGTNITEYPTIAATENLAYGTNITEYPAIAATENLAYGTNITEYPTIAVAENQAYGTNITEYPAIAATENLAYGTNITEYPTIAVAENLAYGINVTTLSHEI